MKTILTITHKNSIFKKNINYVFLIIFLGMFTSCVTPISESLPAKIENATCQNGLVSSHIQTGERNNKTIYEYEFNENGLLKKVKISHTGDYFDRNGSTQPFIENIAFDYDKDGFLLSKKTTVQNVSVIEDTYDVYNATYEYKDGRLMIMNEDNSYVHANDSTGQRRFKYLHTYNYDTKGLLLSHTEKYVKEKQYIYGYDTNGQLSSYKEIVDGKPNDNYNYKFLNGRVVELKYSSSSYGYLEKYSYDAEGQLITDEFSSNNNTPLVTEYKYDNMELPTTVVSHFGLSIKYRSISFKGHPSIPSLFGTLKHNIISEKYSSLERNYSFNYDNSKRPISASLVEKYQDKSPTTSAITLEYCK